MTKNIIQRAPDEREATTTALATHADPPPLQSPTLHNPEHRTPHQANTATQLSPLVRTSTNIRYTQKTSGPYPTTPKKIVTQPSLSVTQTSSHPHHIQHINKDPHRYPYTPLTFIPQHPIPTSHPTIGEDVTMRHNITQEKRKPSINPKE